MTVDCPVSCQGGDHIPGTPTENHPHKDRVCVRCGHRIDIDELPRDIEREREWLRACTRAWHIDVEGLIAFSEQRSRAVDPANERRVEGVRDLLGRDFILEAREELSDAANYLRWRMQQLYALEEAEGEDVGQELQRAADALRAVALAYSAL